jgi:hypothetical protein
LPSKTIPKFLSLFYLLEHSLNEVDIIWKDREKFKGSTKYFINILKELYRVLLEANKKGNKEKPYFELKIKVTNEEFHRRINRICKRIIIHCKFKHIHMLYNKPNHKFTCFHNT